MKKLFPLFTTLFLFALIAACQPARNPGSPGPQSGFEANPQPVEGRLVKTLPTGAPAPDFRLPGVDGKFYTLADFKSAQALVIIFTCNHCPTAQAYEERIKSVVADYKEKNVAFVAISPNSPLGLLDEELGYSDLGDSYADMQIRARHRQFNFPYLYDGDTHAASLQYGPMATPHVFVFDQSRLLRYNGRIDKNERTGNGNAEDLRTAIDAVLAGRETAEAVTETFGCSTKWAWKTEYKDKTDREWAAREVPLSMIDVPGAQALVRNADSKKLRLINVWATWCGPCVLEYPEFVKLQRMYGARDFEFVSLSADASGKKEKVQEFLRNKQSAVSNHLFSEEDKYALIRAVGHGWNGALPFTLLVEPGGKVVWQQQGEVDFLALKRAIVEHPLMGRYY
ncbi:MAG: redoxin family protein [Saprospirales bacterium]|nr:redoxin family protein [Saprospirales bacterium]MBK8923327.1 redoxin family protein [Saprospirales bacterium]